jgi:hypothetical protein
MLLQTNSYIVPKEKRGEHARLMRRFRQILNRIGCDNFEVYEQVGANWGNSTASGRFVQIMRFRDRKHQLAVQAAERTDPTAQELIAEFCELVNYPYQQQNGFFAVGFYTSVLPVAPVRVSPPAEAPPQETEEAAAVASEAEEFQVEDTGQPSETPAQEASEEEFTQQPSFAGAPVETPSDEGGTFEQIPLDDEQGAFPASVAEEETSGVDIFTQEPAEEDEEHSGFVKDESAPAAVVEEADDWSLMNEARAIDDVADDTEEESIGIDLHAEPANHQDHPVAPAAKAEQPSNGEPEIDLGLDDEEPDDLASMADRLAEVEEDQPRAKPRPPTRRR